MLPNMCLSFRSGLPLTTDIEGPTENSSYTFVLGARVIANNEFDLFFEGNLAGVILLPSLAPTSFSQCVLSCLEDMTVDTTGTNIYSSGFDKTQRKLVLMGVASPTDYQLVLSSMVYQNIAPSPNIQAFNLTLDDDINEVHVYIPVSLQTKRKRRSIRHSTKQRRLLSVKQEDSIILDREKEEASLFSHEEMEGASSRQALPNFIPLLATVFISVVGFGALALAIVLWRKRHDSAPAPIS